MSKCLRVCARAQDLGREGGRLDRVCILSPLLYIIKGT